MERLLIGPILQQTTNKRHKVIHFDEWTWRSKQIERFLQMITGNALTISLPLLWTFNWHCWVLDLEFPFTSSPTYSRQFSNHYVQHTKRNVTIEVARKLNYINRLSRLFGASFVLVGIQKCLKIQPSLIRRPAWWLCAFRRHKIIWQNQIWIVMIAIAGLSVNETNNLL